MSFIYDDEKLINDLLKSAIDFENRFLKKAQQAAPAQTPAPGASDPKRDASIALKLLDQLESSVTKQEGDLNITSSVPETQLTALSLEDLGSLVRFLSDTGIMIDNRRIAFNGTDTPPDKNYSFFKLEGNTLFEMTTGADTKVPDVITRGFYIDKALLVKYIVSLQAEEARNNNDVMRVQLGSLIADANKLLGTKIDPNYKPKGPVDPNKKPEGGAAKGPSAQDISIINNMVSPGNLPLDLQTIDFGRIRRFFVNFEKILANSNNQEKASLAQTMQEGRDAMNQAAKMAKNSERINLTGDWRSVKQMISDGKTPITGIYQPFCDTLDTVVEDAAKIVDAFYAMYENTIFNRADYAAARDALINQSQDSNSFAVRNKAVIFQWRSDRDKAVAP